MPVQQLPLFLPLRDDAIFDNFFIGENALLLASLQSLVTAPEAQFIYCYGEAGSGRTHLLQACCHSATENNKTIFYLPLAHHADFSPAIFESLEQQSCVCIDDVDAIVGNQEWEEALFHFYNRAREHHVSLLVSGAQAPKQLKCTLLDLQSRLAWGLTLMIKPLTDVQKQQVLQMRAALRGLPLSEEVACYLIHHYSRNMADLMMMLEKCDRASLIAKRKLTIPFVKEIMSPSLKKEVGA